MVTDNRPILCAHITGVYVVLFHHLYKVFKSSYTGQYDMINIYVVSRIYIFFVVQYRFVSVFVTCA